MSLTLDTALNKTCLIGLSYFDKSGEPLKQTMLGGVVSNVDQEQGITVTLISDDPKKQATTFIMPASLTCWFIAPKGKFHTSHADISITNPDYLVTWDIYQTKNQDQPQDLEQQWWEWVPRTSEPMVG